MSTITFDVEAVRARFPALGRPTLFFDGPSGMQAPAEVVEALARYLLEWNANMGGVYETSRRTTEVYVEARAAAARFFRCSEQEVVFGQNMSTLNFALSRVAGRELEAGDEVVLTRLDHDSNVAPWLELERDRGVAVRLADLRPDGTVDVDHLASLLSERTRIVGFPWAANSIGALVDARRVCTLAHEVGALAWVDAVHYAAHGAVDVREIGADVALCSAYKFGGPHMGLAYGRADVLERWRPYRVRPAPMEPLGLRFESGTPQYELLAGFTTIVNYLDSIGGHAAFAEHEVELGRQFLAGLPSSYDLYGPRSMAGRVATFAFNLPGREPEELATRLAGRGINASAGNYYSPEAMGALGIRAAIRIGISYYNTAEEVERLLDALGEEAGA